MIYVILLEPVIAGNVGAVARAMLNFGFDKLVLINPHCDHLCPEARNRAKHAQNILKEAEVCEFFIVDDYDYLIATTAKIGSDYNIARSPLTPEELASKVKSIDGSKKIGLVMGREDVGLFNEEIEHCDFTVTIPSDKDKPTLNLSHATAIMLYELHKVLGDGDVRSHIKTIGRNEKDQIKRLFAELFDSLHWETSEKRETQEKLWRRVLGKAMLTNREAYSVMGFLRKVLRKESDAVKPDLNTSIKLKKGLDKGLPAKERYTRKSSSKPTSRPAKQTSRKKERPKFRPAKGRGAVKKQRPASPVKKAPATKVSKNKVPAKKAPVMKKSPVKRGGSTIRVAKKKPKNNTPPRKTK